MTLGERVTIWNSLNVTYTVYCHESTTYNVLMYLQIESLRQTTTDPKQEFSYISHQINIQIEGPKYKHYQGLLTIRGLVHRNR